ncbi:glutathione gamma-glutamylcysteinyltransferase 3-like isoform X3 [Camellia sinensis]|uniref:glutathione gamma-glutamylcysteinyltransferase 3-like isoform X3 n=1 Tax=Camellia sinensis TaxID=4442 RepID=UPI0010357983|nr:glutathione gamma-glutamylcysteinyltransferase 3-like isoform X3 [Camellia sinensis]
MLVMFLSQCCWFEDPMIGDSEIMGNVQKKGITSGSFAELARKHVDIEAFKAQHSSLEQFTNCVIQTTSTEELYMILSYSRKTVNQGRDMLLILDVARYKYPFHWLPRMTVWDAMNKIDKETDETRGKHVDIEAFKTQHSSLEQFTNCVIQTTSTEELYMILSYSRKTVNQTGDVHFSPMAAYHKGRDMLLILDVARYKYPFHWLPRMTVWDVMNEIDKETDETRGFMMVRKKIS